MAAKTTDCSDRNPSSFRLDQRRSVASTIGILHHSIRTQKSLCSAPSALTIGHHMDVRRLPYMSLNHPKPQDQHNSLIDDHFLEIVQKANIDPHELDSDSTTSDSEDDYHYDIDHRGNGSDLVITGDLSAVPVNTHTVRAIVGSLSDSDASHPTLLETDLGQHVIAKQSSNGEAFRAVQQEQGGRESEGVEESVSECSDGESDSYRRRNVEARSSTYRSALHTLHLRNNEEAEMSPDSLRQLGPLGSLERGEDLDVRSPISQLDVFGTSVPKADTFTQNAVRSGGRTLAKPALNSSISSSGPLQLFATARSSLASYASAASGPRRSWALTKIRKDGASNPLIKDEKDDQHPRVAAASGPDGLAIESVTNALSERILEDRFFFRNDGSRYRLPVTWHDLQTFQDEGVRAAIYNRLFDLQYLHQAKKETITASLSSIIQIVTSEARTFLRNHNSILWDSAYDMQNLRRDVALLVYEYASSLLDIRDYVPVDRFSGNQPFTSEWLIYLKTRGLVSDNSEALDWSGRGQHAEYLPDEKQIIPLEGGQILGYSASPVVQSMRCRRVWLARKLIRCNKRLTKEFAITEVEHLQRLAHRHVVRLVGTYAIGRELAILIYPVAQWNLEEYLDDNTDMLACGLERAPLWRFLGCLSAALEYIHGHNIKHMDIKPSNLLIRQLREGDHIYVADFGIARAYKTADEACTGSATSFTRSYAAPEVAVQDKRGFSADIFSLGCVFMEIVSVLASAPVLKITERAVLANIRKPPRDNSYYANLDAVADWFRRVTDNREGLLGGKKSSFTPPVLAAFESMLSACPENRPTAGKLALLTRHWGCGHCNDGAEPFKAAVDE